MESTKHVRTSAPYGQACVHCVKAKSRCMLRDGSTCERCHRLDKECNPTSSIRKKSAKRTRASKRDQLEDKLDDLVSLLRTQHTAPQRERSIDQQIITPRSLHESPEQANPETSYDDCLTDLEFVKLRRLHLSYFPFVYLPSSLSPEQLLLEKPLLSSAFKTMCNKAGPQQVELSKRLRETIALKLMVEGEKSLDLLFSVLTCMAWSIYFTSGKKFLVMLASLVRSLVSDLGIDRPQIPRWWPYNTPHVQEVFTQSNENRRALLACYSITAIISMTFKSDIMPWSTTLEEDCRKLAVDAETEGDEILIAMARLSRISLQATEIQRHLCDNLENSGHATMHIGLLNKSLDQFRDTLSEKQKQHPTVAAYLFAAEVSIYELAMLRPPSPSSPSVLLNHERTDYLMACVKACKTCAEYYLSSDMMNLTMPSALIFSYCTKTLHRLSTLQDPAWDNAIVSGTVDVVKLLERCAEKAERCNEILKAETGEDSVFAVAAKTLRDMAPSWRVFTVQDPHMVNGDAAMEGWTGTEELDPQMMDFTDDFWLNGPLNSCFTTNRMSS